MPEVSRHARPKSVAIKLRASIMAAAALAGVAAAITILPGGSAAHPRVPGALPRTSGALKSARHVVPVTNVVVAVSGNDREDPASVRYALESMSSRLVLRARAAARHVHRATHAASRPAPQQTAQPAVQQTPPAAPPTPAVTASSGEGAAGSSLGTCIRDAEEGGSYAWGPGNGGGAYQFLLSTWETYGGAASEYGVAGPAYQDQIFDNAIAAGGASNWTAYDGC
jgi:hypothetical protein